jgi:hypothetical protein
MYNQFFVGGNMNHLFNTSCRASNVSQTNHYYAEHYSSFDLCSQGQIIEGEDNILSRMDKLRAYAREQQVKRVKSQRQQTSFCF